MNNAGDFVPPPAPPKKPPSCWLIGGIGCLGIVILACVSLGLGFYNLSRTGEGKQLFSAIKKSTKMLSSISESANDLVEIRGALIRYQLKTGHYPATLAQLNPDYLQNSSILHCQLDTNPNPSHISFTYIRPAPDAPPSTIILTFQWSYTIPDGKTSVVEKEVLTETLGGTSDMTIYENGKKAAEEPYTPEQ